jgi:alkylation response protein AidB-like acyl-CoA dehydrogenase
MNFDYNEDHNMIRKMVRDFAEAEVAPGAEERDETEEFPVDLWKKCGELGLAGITFPEDYCGIGADYISYSIAVEELSRVDASLGVTVSAHSSLCANPIYKFGTEEQKQKYLPPLATGEKLGAFGLTESLAGSDASGTRTTYVKKGDEYIINGSKIFITNGYYADTYVITAQGDKSKGNRGISAFILEKGTPGFTFGKKEKKMGIRSSLPMNSYLKTSTSRRRICSEKKVRALKLRWSRWITAESASLPRLSGSLRALTSRR